MATQGPIGSGYFDYSQGNFVIRQDYDGNNNAIYIGWAQPGTLTSDSRWRIMQQNFNGNGLMTGTAFPNGSPAFAWVWDNRAIYSFS
jgi:hypothetical protein